MVVRTQNITMQETFRRASLDSAVVSNVVPHLLSRFDPGERSAVISDNEIAKWTKAPSFSNAEIESLFQVLMDVCQGRANRSLLDLVASIDGLADPWHAKSTLLQTLAARLGAMWCEDASDFMAVTTASSVLQRVADHFIDQVEITPAPKLTVGIINTPGDQHLLMRSLIRLHLEGVGIETIVPSDVRQIAELDLDCVFMCWSNERLAAEVKNTIATIRRVSARSNLGIVAGGAAAQKHHQTLMDHGVNRICEDVYAAVAFAQDHALTVLRSRQSTQSS